jgi:predicted metal-binding membrane protein
MQVISAIGLVRPARRRGFCPACRGWIPPSEERIEVAPPALAALAVLGVAVVAWGYVIAQSRSMGGMAMGLGTPAAFATVWLLMMTAMMLPTALPLVSEFVRGAERRRGWQLSAALLVGSYLAVWFVFGLVCYALYDAVRMPWPDQNLAGGIALAAAGVYSLTPVQRSAEARCRQVCALHGPQPFSVMRSAVRAGIRYGLSCVGCSGALMIAAVLVGMSSLGWMAILTALILVYKLAARPTLRSRLALAAAVAALGVTYALITI